MLMFIMMTLIIGIGLVTYYLIIMHVSTLAWYDESTGQLYATFTCLDKLCIPTEEPAN